MEQQASLPRLSQDSLMPSTEISRPGTPDDRPVSRSASPGPSNQAKFASPVPPPASSMTPPPSSQLPTVRSTTARTPTPPTPQLTSPPPTTKLFSQASILADSAGPLYSPEQINDASADELRVMVTDLTAALRDIRLSAAHYKLQYNMAVMESQEAASRMAVELAMAQREIDVLQQAEERRRNAVASPVQSLQDPPVNPANALMISELNRTCQVLQNENERYRDLVEQQKRVIEHREGELASLMEENNRLKSRIRANRDHIAPLLPFLEQMNEQSSPRSVIGTPHHGTPRSRTHRATAQRGGEASRGQNNFEALLLADKMLSQETATAPSTPNRTHAPRSRFGHSRGAQSMSSLPQTPNRRTAHVQPQTPPVFSLNNIPQSAPPAHYLQKPGLARRDSSNSTITASSVDDEEAFTEHEDEEVPESQASQMATSMLRRAVPPSTQAPPPSQSYTQSQLVQSKIYGHVKKGNIARKPGEYEKRRLPSPADHHGSPTKRGRVDQGVGLGIGGVVRD
ncbi:uncharacterized protein EI97DRAFT_429981 [Westerdykella ornata]|uniref:Uncharacterized protein n=1 Tax=Westerdykella ornata TaxID=318751 RepID=A0A6A6JVG4_WESOR|nr:uncharacterized protein EI97DRAFT_429981 [Westerdykella ornata]KAF2280225.1 hypothetical protein EI97DRAFT_429981 [Westerdykella ornata]